MKGYDSPSLFKPLYKNKTMEFKTKEDVQSYIEQMNEKKEVIEHAIDCAEKCMEGFVTYDELTDIDELEVAPKL